MTKRIAQNIKLLREYYSQTQEELGVFLNVSNTTVSKYENGRNEPDADILRRIADYYSVSVEELMYGDFSYLRGSLWKRMNILPYLSTIVPMVSSEDALNVEDFRAALIIQQREYCELQKIKEITKDLLEKEWVSAMDECIDHYLVAIEQEQSEYEALANLIGLEVFVWIIMKGAKSFSLDSFQNIDLKGVIPGIDKMIKELSDSGGYKELSEIRSSIDKGLKDLKSSKYSDLAYYYSALIVMFDGDTSRELIERRNSAWYMLDAFAELGNKYASDLLEVVGSID